MLNGPALLLPDSCASAVVPGSTVACVRSLPYSEVMPAMPGGAVGARGAAANEWSLLLWLPSRHPGSCSCASCPLLLLASWPRAPWGCMLAGAALRAVVWRGRRGDTETVALLLSKRCRRFRNVGEGSCQHVCVCCDCRGLFTWAKTGDGVIGFPATQKKQKTAATLPNTVMVAAMAEFEDVCKHTGWPRETLQKPACMHA